MQMRTTLQTHKKQHIIAILSAILLSACTVRLVSYGELNHDALVDLLSETVRVRGLQPRTPITFRVVRAESNQSDSTSSRSGLSHKKSELLRLLGVIRGTETLPQAHYKVMRSGMVFAFYAGKGQGIWIVDSGIRSDILEIIAAFRGRDPIAKPMVHEITHALQEQHFEINNIREQLKTTDAQLAFRALVEGDAQLTAILYDDFFSPETNAGLFKLLIAKSGPRTAEVYLRETAQFLYGDGPRFVDALHNAGNDSFVLVDQAYQKPPASTLEVLFPQIYLKGITLEDVTLPSLATGKATFEDRLGAITLGMFLGDLTDQQSAQNLLKAWRGDCAQLIQEKGGVWARWAIIFSSGEAAETFADLASLRCPNPNIQQRLVILTCRGDK
jgi:hypothetical protein